VRLRSIAFLAAFAAGSAAGEPPAGQGELTRDIYRELVEINTAQPRAQTSPAARAMARRLLDAGFAAADVEVYEPVPGKGNLVARYRGTGEMKPLLLLAHIDVVDARREDWSGNLDPFKLTEADGYYYGRGTLDDKAMAAIFVANLIRYRREGLRPRRDIIVALTADEEAGEHNGVEVLLKERRALIDAELALNEGGGGTMRNGKPFVHAVQVSEKVYQSFAFEATHAGGHSSLPGRDNAIYDLARALDRLSQLQFPVRQSVVTRLYFGKLAANESGAMGEAVAAVAAGRATEAQLRQVSTVPRYNAQLRTTCVATRLEGGHADNALPQRARAIVNCRIFPGERADAVAQELQRVAGERVTVKAVQDVTVSEPSDPQSPAMRAIERVSESLWPGVPVVPVMSAGATDGLQLRNAGIPVYGLGFFVEQGENRMHGRDERLGVRAFEEGAEFLYRVVAALASGS
jgi:acetylornithine deacetylase/succinyl-diaminopimelate desuccinylase-like protein